DNQYGQGRELVRTATDYVTEITMGSSAPCLPPESAAGAGRRGGLPTYLGATSSVCKARPNAPRRSESRVIPSPVPLEPTDVVASSRSHSPTGSRGRVTVRSTLMKMKSVDGRAAPTPLPESATNSVRDIGEASSPASNGIRGRVHAARTRDCAGP